MAVSLVKVTLYAKMSQLPKNLLNMKVKNSLEEKSLSMSSLLNKILLIPSKKINSKPLPSKRTILSL